MRRVDRRLGLKPLGWEAAQNTAQSYDDTRGIPEILITVPPLPLNYNYRPHFLVNGATNDTKVRPML